MAEENVDEQERGDMPIAEKNIDEQEMGDMPMAEKNIDEQEVAQMGDMPQKSNTQEVQEFENNTGADVEKKWPGWPGENVFRMLVPVHKVGRIIGRKGELIKKICEETKARIKILDGPPGSTERAVMFSAKEEPDVPIPPAMDGLLKVHKRITDGDSDPAVAPSGAGGVVCTRLLVAASQAGTLIGKQGASIKSIQDTTSCVIRVRGEENLPPFALPDDSVVEIQGEPTGVHKAVELIATHLRKFLVDRSVIQVFEMEMQMPNIRANQNMPSHQSWGPPPQSFAMNAADGPYFEPYPQYMPPPRQFDNYYPPADQSPLDKLPPRQGPPAYGRDASMGAHPKVQPPQSIVTKITQNMQIPLLYADAVIGSSGANISYIRRASGANIAIQETMGVPGEMSVEITGSAAQVQTAQQLIQNSLAEAASMAQNPTGPPTGQGYNSYPSQGGAVYASPQSNTSGHTGHELSGEYGSVYGSNYGY